LPLSTHEDEMHLDAFIINTFSDTLAEGNPAGVIIHRDPLSDDTMLKIAVDIGKSETAFVREDDVDAYSIRWFSPKREMPICGHATLAAAKAIFESKGSAQVTFTSAADVFRVTRGHDGSISMAFPLDRYEYIQTQDDYYDFFPEMTITKCIVGKRTKKVILIVADNTDIEAIDPDFAVMVKKHGIFDNGIGITKRSETYDFESRYFNPWAGVNEDPITVTVHSVLARYWSDILHKNVLVARQASYRPGVLRLVNENEKVLLSGKARIVIEGTLQI
jgi:PhzF family phenazine biosynthesis protein